MTDELAELDALWQGRARVLTAADAAHEALREGILQGRIPAGFRLSEVAIAQRFSISRTPVREALLRLEAERLVERNGRGGMVVGEVTQAEILELYVVREAINGLVARLAAEHARAVDIGEVRWLNDELRRAGEAGDFGRMAVLNLQFHDALCRSTRNDLLLMLMRQVHDRVRRFPGTTFSFPGRAAEAPREHEQLLQAIEAHDAERAERLARSHMVRAMQLRVEMLRRDRFPGGDGDGRPEQARTELVGRQGR